MFCVKCGKEINNGKEICTACESRLNENTDFQMDQSNEQINIEESKDQDSSTYQYYKKSINKSRIQLLNIFQKLQIHNKNYIKYIYMHDFII